MEIAWLCPGKAAKEFRRQGAVTLCRALGGDLTLVDEIEKRHAEVAGTEVQKVLLQGTETSAVGHKRKAGGYLDLTMEERARYNRDTVRGYLEIFEVVGGLDEATKACLRDFSKNSLLQLSQSATSPVSSPVTWSVVMRAQALGFQVTRKDWAELGKEAIRAYRGHYGSDPKCGKKPGISGDTGFLVWHYTEDECEECVDEAIRSYYRD